MESKVEKAVKKGNLSSYGFTRKTGYSFLAIFGCLVLILVLSITQARFEKDAFLDLQYWVNFAIVSAITIFGMITGQQMGDDVSKNNPSGNFRKTLNRYSDIYEKINEKKLFAFFEDWLEDFRQRKIVKKIQEYLKDNGVHQFEVLDLDLLELNNLKSAFKKDWKETKHYEKYFDKKTNESVTYFLSYTEEQIECIKNVFLGKIKVSKLPKSFFMDALNRFSKDMWESASKSNRKKSMFLSLNYFYKIFGLLAMSLITTGLVGDFRGGISKSTIAIMMMSRAFTLTMAVIWGFYIGSELTKIDTSYMIFKVNVLSQYNEEIELNVYSPISIEEKAKKMYEESVKENEQEAILD